MHPVLEWGLGGLGACGACFFSNPLEVVKTRMQLQGELQGRGSYQRHYRNVFHAFYTIGKYDGLLALQKGLAPGLIYQFVMNGIRLGSYQIIQNTGFTRNPDGRVSYFKSMIAGASAGCVGAFFGSPVYMIKTHLQAQADTSIAVGTQHGHSSFSKAVVHVFREHGITGLWRGVTGALMRVSVGSATQLSSFSKAKDFISRQDFFAPRSIMIPLTASMFGSVVVVCAMTPFDVVSTRLYNQGVSKSGKGLLYDGFLDCVRKIYTREGPLAFYKGIGASYFRLGPHTVLSLVFWDTLRETFQQAFLEK